MDHNFRNFGNIPRFRDVIPQQTVSQIFFPCLSSDWLRVVSSAQTTYELRYFQINNEDEDEEGEDES